MSSRLEDGVSICIPNWNHRHYLSRSVGSALRAATILHEKGIGCQVLVVDDMSRDGSQTMLFSLAMQQGRDVLDVVLAPENQGLGATRNLAVKHARYRWICFLDADNELVPENLDVFRRAIVETGAAFVYGNLLMTDESGPTGLLSSDVVTEDLYSANYIDAFAIVDADKVEDFGGYYGKHAAAHEDWEFLLHLIAENQLIVFVPMFLGFYHTSGLSMIRTVPYDHSRMHRVYNQRATGFPTTFQKRRIYLPGVGWI